MAVLRVARARDDLSAEFAEFLDTIAERDDLRRTDERKI